MATPLVVKNIFVLFATVAICLYIVAVVFAIATKSPATNEDVNVVPEPSTVVFAYAVTDAPAMFAV